MDKSPATSSKSIERFWDRYLEFLDNQGSKPSAARWYVLLAERYTKAFPDKKLADHGPQDVTGYLQQPGHPGQIHDWQYRQAVDAIRNLFRLISVKWNKEVDWQIIRTPIINLA